MVRVKRIEPVATGKAIAGAMAIFGLIIGVLVALFAGVVGSVAGEAFGSVSDGMMTGAGVGLASIILFPIMYAIVGFVGTWLFCVMYNFATKYTGCIEFEMDKK